MVTMEDASGWQKFEYGKLGEVTKNLRTFALPHEQQPYTFVMEYEYDSYNRIQSVTYPDGEKVSYGYDQGGMLKSMKGEKNGTPYTYIDNIVYNEFGLKESVCYGNGAKASYKYDVLLRLAASYSETSMQEPMQEINYKYDAVGNITNIVNYAAMLANGLGGTYGNDYHYDDLYRLVYSTGGWNENYHMIYEVEMEYLPNGRILRKNLHGDIFWQTPYNHNHTSVHYYNDYHYTNTSQPNTLSYIDNTSLHTFAWDVKGNMVFHQNGSAPFNRNLCWDERNRLQGVKEEGHFSYYQYDANGDRVYKLAGDAVRQNRNGERNDYYYMSSPTLYASPYLVATPQGYTKHYYAGDERIASKIGGGGLANIYLNEYPELFGTHRDLSNEHYTSVQACLGAYAVADNNPLGSLYGWREIVVQEKDCYWYHPDHLGSTSWITSLEGKAVQHLHYLPWGEDFVDQRGTNWNAMYTFSAKEKDTETGLSYFGARYYSSDLSIWLSVDPMSDKYPSLSPYAYCANNPIKLVDPNGEDYETIIDKESKTITVVALYYAADSDKEKLQKGIDAWNAQSGKYTYTIEDGENAGTYTINFELSIHSQDGSNCPQDGISNSFSITSDNIEGKGQALSSNDIIIQEKSSVRTIIHEIGHTIGIGDFTNGVMQSGGTSTKITKGHISKTLENAGFTCLGTVVGTQTVPSYSQSCEKNERIESVGNTVGYLRKRK